MEGGREGSWKGGREGEWRRGGGRGLEAEREEGREEGEIDRGIKGGDKIVTKQCQEYVQVISNCS